MWLLITYSLIFSLSLTTLSCARLRFNWSKIVKFQPSNPQCPWSPSCTRYIVHVYLHWINYCRNMNHEQELHFYGHMKRINFSCTQNWIKKTKHQSPQGRPYYPNEKTSSFFFFYQIDCLTSIIDTYPIVLSVIYIHCTSFSFFLSSVWFI